MTVRAQIGNYGDGLEYDMADIMATRNFAGNVVYTVSNQIKTDPTAADITYSVVNNSGVMTLFADTGSRYVYFTYSVTEFKYTND